MWTCELLYRGLNIPTVCSRVRTLLHLCVIVNVLEFCYRSVPIIRYLLHLIKPLFFKTRGRFISHVIAFALALMLSNFFPQPLKYSIHTAPYLAHIILFETCKPHLPVLTLYHTNSIAIWPIIILHLLEFNQMALTNNFCLCAACYREHWLNNGGL